MLVLTRKQDEQIVIPSHGISLVITQIRGDRVRIGVKAPPDTKVHRGEVWLKIQAEDLEDLEPDCELGAA